MQQCRKRLPGEECEHDEPAGPCKFCGIRFVYTADGHPIVGVCRYDSGMHLGLIFVRDGTRYGMCPTHIVAALRRADGPSTDGPLSP